MGFDWMLKIADTLSSMLRFSAEKFVYPDRPDIKLSKLPLTTHIKILFYEQLILNSNHFMVLASVVRMLGQKLKLTIDCSPA